MIAFLKSIRHQTPPLTQASLVSLAVTQYSSSAAVTLPMRQHQKCIKQSKHEMMYLKYDMKLNFQGINIKYK